jgi:hypothetical protein
MTAPRVKMWWCIVPKHQKCTEKKIVSGIFFLWPWTDSMKGRSTGNASKSFETGLYTQLPHQHIFKFLKSHFIIHINTDVWYYTNILVYVWCACECIKFVYIIDMDCMVKRFLYTLLILFHTPYYMADRLKAII